MSMGKRLIVSLAAIVAACGLTGCAGFEGKRNISLKLGILGNSVEWNSSCAGKYQMESPVVK